MNIVTCVCGKTSKAFKHLNQTSFGRGWIAECCPEVKEESSTLNVPRDLEDKSLAETNIAELVPAVLKTMLKAKPGRPAKKPNT